jgi:hypothetical protein
MRFPNGKRLLDLVNSTAEDGPSPLRGVIVASGPTEAGHVYSRRAFLTSAGAVLGATALPPKMWALSRIGTNAESTAGQDSSPKVPLLLGVDYYPDQTPQSLWEEDARMMADFGFTNVRVAEFAWSLMEP